MLQMVYQTICFILLTNLHPFHVSVCEVYHNAESNALEISMKIFVDDLELAVQESGATDFKLVDQDEKNIEKEKLKNYLKERFEITVDDKNVDLEFIGFEFDQDAALCYFEAKHIRKMSSIEIKNSIITEVFADQINLTHVLYHGEMKSLKAVKEQPVGIIDTSGW